MKKYKKLLSITLSLCILAGFATTAGAEVKVDTVAKCKTNLFDAINHPEKYTDMEVTVDKTTEEYIKIIKNDTNLAEQTKLGLINEVISEQENENPLKSVSYGCLTFKTSLNVSDNYTATPSFTCIVQYINGSPTPDAIVGIVSADIDTISNGISKSFYGMLYYNLESDNTIYWDINGDFYDKGTATIMEDASNKPANSGRVNFIGSKTGKANTYIQKAGRIKVAI